MELPSKVFITEVSPRDGLQNIKKFVPTEEKINICKMLIDSGVPDLEVTSFVNPKAVPQMADCDEVVSAVKEYAVDKNTDLTVLAMNQRGVERALNSGIRSITYVVSASDSHSRSNSGMTTDEAVSKFEKISSMYPEADYKFAVAVTFGCPFGDIVTAERVAEIVERGLNSGAKYITLSDTVGLAAPSLVNNILDRVCEVVSADRIILHMHDTRGLAAANMFAALERGVIRFETSAGGLGGCPFAPGASGNAATEDILYMFDEMKVFTGIKKDLLYKTVNYMREKGLPVNSHLSLLNK